MGVKLAFSSTPPLQEEENWEFAALPPLLSAVKSIFQFSSALRGGKLETALMLRVHVSEIFQSDFLILFSLLLLVGGSWVGA